MTFIFIEENEIIFIRKYEPILSKKVTLGISTMPYEPLFIELKMHNTQNSA